MPEISKIVTENESQTKTTSTNAMTEDGDGFEFQKGDEE